MNANLEQSYTSSQGGDATHSVIEAIGAHYQPPATGQSYHDSGFAISKDAERWVMRRRAKKFQHHLKPTDTVAEYGVGHGWNLGNLQCAKRFGYDISPAVEPVVRSHGIEFVKSWQDLKDASMQVVICCHVLEHVPMPLDALLEIRRALAPQGKLLLIVPYEIERQARRYDANDQNLHLYGWSVQSLGNLVHLSGFEVGHTSIRKYGYDRAAAVCAKRLHLGEVGFHAIQNVGLMVRPRREIYMVATRNS